MQISDDPISRMPAAQRVYLQLHEDLIQMELQPGQSLSEKEISARFGISRQPVREAFIRLAQEGLLDIRPQVGTFVSKIDMNKIHETIFARTALECANVRLAAANVTEQGIQRLWEILEIHQKAYDAKDDDQVNLLDQRFHATLLEFGGYPGLWPMVRQIRVHMLRVRKLAVSTLDSTPDAIAEHTKVVEALVRHDADDADHCIRSHIERNLEYMTKIRHERPEFFFEPVEDHPQSERRM